MGFEIGGKNYVLGPKDYFIPDIQKKSSEV
jgi:hypothetical protein